MKNKFTTYSTVLRSLWLIMAVFVVVLCGPVKKLIELKVDRSGSSSLQYVDKKLKTWYREKRDIVSPVKVVAPHQVPGDGTPLLASSSFISIPFVHRQGHLAKLRYIRPAIVPELPLYLHISRLQV